MKDSSVFQVAAVVVILAFDGRDLKVALYKRDREPFIDQYSLPAGLVKEKESIDEAALRVLKEKTGIDRLYLEQIHAFGKLERDPAKRTIGVAYYALVHFHDKDLARYGAKWENLKNVKIKAFDHQQIIEYTIKSLKNNMLTSNIIHPLLHSKFTLTELQAVYEVILDKKIDKRNFRKKILASGLIQKTDEKLMGKKQRPALLYVFKNIGSNPPIF